MRSYLLFIIFQYIHNLQIICSYFPMICLKYYFAVFEENDYLYFKRLSYSLKFFKNVRCYQTKVKFTQQPNLNNCHNNYNKTIFYLRTDSKDTFVN